MPLKPQKLWGFSSEKKWFMDLVHYEKAAESRLASCNNPQRLKVVPFQDSRDFLLLLGTRNSLLI